MQFNNKFSMTLEYVYGSLTHLLSKCGSGLRNGRRARASSFLWRHLQQMCTLSNRFAVRVGPGLIKSSPICSALMLGTISLLWTQSTFLLISPYAWQPLPMPGYLEETTWAASERPSEELCSFSWLCCSLDLVQTLFVCWNTSNRSSEAKGNRHGNCHFREFSPRCSEGLRFLFWWAILRWWEGWLWFRGCWFGDGA